MDYEQIITTLKGISGILAALSETHMTEIIWGEFGLPLLNRELMKCIRALEANIPQ